MKKLDDLRAKIEAMLFAAGDPVEICRLAEVIEVDSVVVEDVISDLKELYAKNKSGIKVIEFDNKVQLCSDEKYADDIRKLLEVKKNTPLSQAAFEVLAIIAYNKEVTKSFIEQVRGVDCSGTISNLIQKDLIEEKGRLDLPGKPLVYGTTDRFLRCFSLNSLDDLPDLPNKDKNDKSEESQTSLFVEKSDKK